MIGSFTALLVYHGKRQAENCPIHKTGCKKIVRLGRGLWGPWDFCWDGHKYVCQDDLAEGAACLVYSFGVGGAGGAAFEKAMAAGGCDVYAHDHTAQDFPDTGYGNLHFVRTGIGPVNNVTEEGELKTLETLLRENGHTETVINYLKVCLTEKCYSLAALMFSCFTGRRRRGRARFYDSVD